MGSNKELYKKLKESEFGCVPPGFHDTTDVYEWVQEVYHDLCDDSILCKDVCNSDSTQPEWKHRIRTLQQHLVDQPESRVSRLSDGWYYGPKDVDVASVPADEPVFEVGKRYNRWELHDIYGGQRYRGIATPKDQPLVFLFTGDSGEDYGYEDEFLPDDTFLYTGEGTDGDMTMDGGNAAIRHHRDENEALHLFEDTEYPWIVSYVGEYRYVDHEWDTLRDENREKRQAVRFQLEPVGGTEVEFETGTPSSIPLDELYEKAKQSSPTRRQKPSASPNSRSYQGSEVVKAFALRTADGVCQGCGQDAPFIGRNGRPYLEVHHLTRRSDGGADSPENVIALCPNCHRRVHHGKDGKEFNQELIEKARNRQFGFG